MFKLVINISQTEDQNLLNVNQTEVYNFKAKMNLDQNMNHTSQIFLIQYLRN